MLYVLTVFLTFVSKLTCLKSDSYQGDIFDEYFNDSGTFHQKTNDYSLNRDPIEDTTIGKELVSAPFRRIGVF